MLPGSFSFTAQATDADGTKAERPISITIAAGLVITTTQVPNGVLNQAYVALTFAAIGGTPPYTWSSTGTLPPGMSLSPNGMLTGTPTTLGSYSFTVQVKDANGVTYSAPFTIQVVQPSLTITTSSLTPAVGESTYQATFAASGGAPPYTWSASAARFPLG